MTIQSDGDDDDVVSQAKIDWSNIPDVFLIGRRVLSVSHSGSFYSYFQFNRLLTLYHRRGMNGMNE